MLTLPPAGHEASAALPLTFSRTTLVHAHSTISTDGTSVPAEAPLNVRVNPPLPAPLEVAVPANPEMALTAAVMLPLVTATPPSPIRPEVASPIFTRYAVVAGLNPVSVTCCC